MSEKHNSFIESTNPSDERLEALKQLYPELFADGKLNIDVLKEITGGENPQEERTPGYYGLYWPGKRKAKIEAKAAPKGTLVPVPGDGVNEDTTHNIYIEGDNLEVLRILKQSYKGRVKMIYIDPPYNTGNDFIYPDNYKMAVDEYMKLTGQVDEKGKALTTNQKSNGAFHTNWLNMMLPRLMLARELLTEDGVIFISIDDNEQANLKLLCDDVFGEENCLANLVWRKKYTGGKGTSTFADYHEYILAYSKNIDSLGEISMARPDEEKEKFTLIDEYIEERGKYYTRPLKSNLDPRPTLVYPIQLPDGSTCTTQWICAENTYFELLKEGRIEFKDSKSSKYPVYKKFYEKDSGGNVKIPSFIEISNNNEAKEELKTLFKVEQTRDLPFQTPKPTKLLRLFIDNFLNESDIVMDFFSGSASTAEAIFSSSVELKKKQKFILIQMPEKTKEDESAYKMGFDNICEIGKERIRRAGKQILNQVQNDGKDNSLFAEESKENKLDIGFKVYCMQDTNFTTFTPVSGQDENAQASLFAELEKNATPLVEGWKTENVLTEIILKQGFALDCDCKKVESFTHNTVYCIKDSEGPAKRTTTMYVCLDSIIDAETIKSLKLDEKEKFVCLDSAIDDTSYARLCDKGRIETI